jgi:hypothetical protein
MKMMVAISSPKVTIMSSEIFPATTVNDLCKTVVSDDAGRFKSAHPAMATRKSGRANLAKSENFKISDNASTTSWARVIVSLTVSLGNCWAQPQQGACACAIANSKTVTSSSLLMNVSANALVARHSVGV